MGKGQRIIVAIDLDYFFAQCEEIRHPGYKSKPVVVCVYSGRTEESGAVSSVNYYARKLGIKSGIPIVNAKRLLSNQNDVVFLHVDHEYYESVSERVMDIIRSSSPSSPFEQASIDEAYLDVSERTRGDYAMAALLTRDLKDEIMEKEKLSATLGVGSSKLISKMAADAKKPNGLAVVQPEDVPGFLKDLPVGKLIGIGPKIEEKMTTLGIFTIGHLSSYDNQILSKTFGRNLGPRLRMLANGVDEDPVRERTIEQFSRIVTLKLDVNSFSFRDQLIQLARDISERLKEHGLKSKTIGIIAITSDLKTKSKARSVEEATDSFDRISDEASALFQELFRSSEDLWIRRAGLRVSALETKEEKGLSEDQETLSSFFPPESIV